MASNIDFPIFIGSTHYDLVDLRAELSAFLKNLGYRPVLSSEDGFPDGPAQLEPWESCLDMLKSCLVAVIILDDKYGKPLPWPHFKEIFEGREVSPTHGEFLYAKAVRKPMLIFIREHLMGDYQRYRQAIKNKGDACKALDHLHLPNHIDKQVLEFIKEIKTTRPIPWIHQFRDITQVKIEVQTQLLNELAKAFQVKDNQIDVLLHQLNQILEGMSDDDKVKYLRRIGCASELIDRVEQSSKEKESLQAQLQEKNDALEAAEGKSQEDIAQLTKAKEALEVKIEALRHDSIKLTRPAVDVLDFGFEVSGLQPGSSPSSLVLEPSGSQFSFDPSVTHLSLDSSASQIFADPNTVVLSQNICAGCSKSLGSFPLPSAYCSKCNRPYCQTCSPDNVVGPSERICSKCQGT